MNKSLVLLMVSVATLAGCAGSGVGASEGTTPPRIIQTKDGNIWDNISNFGPVPANLKATGAQICSSVNPKWVALGYHSRAEGVDTKAIPGGGYLCGTN